MVIPRLCETARPLFKRLRDYSTCSGPEIPRLLFRMPRFRDWADIFRDASFSHRPFYSPTIKRKWSILGAFSTFVLIVLVQRLPTCLENDFQTKHNKNNSENSLLVIWLYYYAKHEGYLPLFCTPTRRLITFTENKEFARLHTWFGMTRGFLFQRILSRDHLS